MASPVDFNRNFSQMQRKKTFDSNGKTWQICRSSSKRLLTTYNSFVQQGGTSESQHNWIRCLCSTACVCVCVCVCVCERDSLCCQCVVSFSHAFHAKGCPKIFSMKRNNSIKNIQESCLTNFLKCLKRLIMLW